MFSWAPCRNLMLCLNCHYMIKVRAVIRQDQCPTDHLSVSWSGSLHYCLQRHCIVYVLVGTKNCTTSYQVRTSLSVYLWTTQQWNRINGALPHRYGRFRPISGAFSPEPGIGETGSRQFPSVFCQPRVQSGKLKGRVNLVVLGIDGKILLKYVSEE
jgi:hypothetical protein